MAARPATITIPSSDAGFRTYVDDISANEEPETADDLQARLRRVFPRVLVRERSLSGERPAWYVYRDGGWRPPTTGPWWLESDTPRLEVSADGWLVAANETARGLLAIAPSDLTTRHFTDFVPSATLADAENLFAIVLRGQELNVTIRLRPTTGDVIAVDMHARRDGNALVGFLRLADDVPFIDDDGPYAVPTLECHPAADRAFASYAQLALSRMPEATPEGLVLRLRRLYPHARVEVAGDRWTCHRDPERAAHLEQGWWRDRALPSVTYDGDGLILDANDAACRLLGRDLVGRHWHELVTPGSTEQVTSMLEILAQTGGAESRFRMPNAAGALIEFDSYTSVETDSFRTIMRAMEPEAARP